MRYLLIWLLTTFAAFGGWNEGAFLERLKQVESKGNHNAIGDHGRARGAYQFHRRTWSDITARLRAQNRPTTDWLNGATDPAWASMYAREHVRWLVERLNRSLGRFSEQWLYAAWNVGADGVAQTKGNLKALPKLTQRKLKSFSGTTIEFAI